MLRITDDKERTGLGNALFPILDRFLGSQIEEDLGLHWVRILELVDQEITVTAVDVPDQRTACFGVRPECVSQIEQIIAVAEFALRL